MNSRCVLISAALALLLSACQTAEPSFQPGTEAAAEEQRQLAEARAFGTAQGAIGVAKAFDPTGLSSIPVTLGGRAAHRAWLASGQARMEAAQEKDLQALYKKVRSQS
jgi:hypothetical protein